MENSSYSIDKVKRAGRNIVGSLLVSALSFDALLFYLSNNQKTEYNQQQVQFYEYKMKQYDKEITKLDNQYMDKEIPKAQYEHFVHRRDSLEELFKAYADSTSMFED